MRDYDREFDRAEREAQEPPDDPPGREVECEDCEARGVINCTEENGEVAYDSETGEVIVEECKACDGTGMVFVVDGDD